MKMGKNERSTLSLSLVLHGRKVNREPMIGRITGRGLLPHKDLPDIVEMVDGRSTRLRTHP